MLLIRTVAGRGSNSRPCNCESVSQAAAKCMGVANQGSVLTGAKHRIGAITTSQRLGGDAGHAGYGPRRYYKS